MEEEELLKRLAKISRELKLAHDRIDLLEKHSFLNARQLTLTNMLQANQDMLIQIIGSRIEDSNTETEHAMNQMKEAFIVLLKHVDLETKRANSIKLNP